MKTDTMILPLISRPLMSELESLYRLYSSMVYRICLRYTKDRHDAEDMVSEVFVKVDRHEQQYRGDSKPMVWIYRIAVNQCLDYLKSRRSRHEAPLEELETNAAGNIEGEGDRILARITLDRILAKTSPITRKILFLSHIEGLTHEEIGKVLNVTREAITKKLGRFSRHMKHLENEASIPAFSYAIIPAFAIS